MSDNTGVIYILTNPSFPEYVKIGYADDINKRLKQLNRSECTPFAFRVYATYEVNSRLSDLKIHSIIDKLNPDLRSIETVSGQQRVREFYATIEYADDPSLTCIVADERNVTYQGKTLSLTALAKLLSGKKSSIAGPRYFKYKGEMLNDIRKRLGI